jgi:[acyl-carrier-protein] S-malonyltransferase
LIPAAGLATWLRKWCFLFLIENCEYFALQWIWKIGGHYFFRVHRKNPEVPMSLDPKTTALIFPGQGSQFTGMGKALAESYPEAKQVFELADSILEMDFSRLCWEGPDSELNDTMNTQPALLVHSTAVWAVLQARMPQFVPACVAGHSLGEFSALVAAGALAIPDAIRMTRERGRLMRQAGEAKPGGMAAILNLETAKLAEVCAEAAKETGGVVQVANDNSPGQVVISGEVAALERAMALATARGAKRAIRLPVSIASHSALMSDAARQFALLVDSTPMRAPGCAVIGNTTAQSLTTTDAIRAELKAQLTSPVRWVDSVHHMEALGATFFVELGAKDVLTGLLKRIAPNARGMAAGDPAEFQKILDV